MPFKIANPFMEVTLQKFGGLYTECDPRDLPQGASPLCYDVDFIISGVGPRPGLRNIIPNFAPPPGSVDFQYLKGSTVPGGLNQVLAQDSGGGLWAQNIQGPPIMSRFYQGILNGARALSETVNLKEFFTLSNLKSGADQPRQWDGTHLDRISQVGPGQGPSVPSAKAPIYTISSISQPFASVSINSLCWGAYINLYSAPPPATNLYFLSTVGATTFTTGLDIGDTVYVSGVSNISGQNPNGTYTVVSVGYYTDVDGTRQYFGVVSDQALGNFARGTAGGNYQQTLAIIQLSNPIPSQDAVVGQNITVSGSSVQGWNTTWQIVDTPTEGQLQISATSLTSNIATYTYSLSSGEAPGWQASHEYNKGTQIVDGNGTGHVWQVTTPGTSGGSVPTFPASPAGPVTDGTVTWTYVSGAKMNATVFNTSNGNGIFNVQNKQILSASSTTFTAAITSPTIGSSAEDGQAVSGSGSALVIDPGLTTIGTGHPGQNPIFGSATGGTVLPTGDQVTPGQRYAICLFLTRNGYITPASPPVSFFTTGSTTQITASNLPIGPANVIARIVAITAANSGVGGPYFWIPNDVVLATSEASLGQTQTINKTVVEDNSTTTLGPVNFSDSVLTASINVSITGNNAQQQRELGECVKAVQYAGRVVYIGERTKTDNFVNLTFDGGSVSGKPAGWSIASGLSPYVSLIDSPIFGKSLYINNTSGSTLTAVTMLQGAYQDAIQAPIIQPNTAYSVRVTAWTPSGSATGSLVVDLVSPSLGTSWPFTVHLASMSTSPQEFIGPLNNPLWSPVPSDLELRIYPLSLPNGADIAVDRIEIYPTLQPTYTTRAAVSYVQNPEAIDAITGGLDTSRFTSAPQTNAFVFLDQLYITCEDQDRRKTFRTNDRSGTEPSGWQIDEISNTVGSCGPLASDVGEEYVLVASRPGLYIFDGGNHIKVSQEIQQVWDSINWAFGQTIWVRNDIHNQRILVGVPLPTPNQWLPNAPTNANPSTPNVVLMCSYLTLANGAAIGEATPIHTSMFSGHLIFRDGARKWTIWQIKSPCAAFIPKADGKEQLWFGGTGTGKIYELDPTMLSDDGTAIQETYYPSPFVDSMNEVNLQLGSVRKIFPYASVLIEGAGKWNLTTYPETPSTNYTSTQPAFTLANPAKDDTNVPLNETGNRLFLKMAVDGVAGSYFNLRRIVMAAQRDPRIGVSGR